MAVDMFLDLGKIKGESQDKVHKDKIELLSWSWGVVQTGTFARGTTGGGTGKVDIQDMSFTHYVDKASVDLFQYCAQGKHIDKAVLICRKAGGDPLEYLTIEMKDVLVTGISHGASSGESRQTENVTLNFEKVKVKYKQQTEKGAPGASPEFGWDAGKNAQQ